MPTKVEFFLCDDARQELNGFFSIMGIYGPELAVGAYPHNMQRGAFLFRVYRPVELKPLPVKFEIQIPGAELMITEVTLEGTTIPPFNITVETCVFRFINLPIPQPGYVRVYATIGAERRQKVGEIRFLPLV